MATSTVKSSGGDYSSLSAWEAAKQADLTGLGDEIAECDAFVDTAQCNINGWTTTASDRIICRAASGQKHSLTRGTGYRLEFSSINAPLIIHEEYVEIDGLAVSNTGTNEGIGLYSTGGAGNTKIKNCFLYDCGAEGVYDRSLGSHEPDIENCVAVGCGDYGFRQFNNAYFCTILNGERGFSTGAVTKNCISVGNVQIFDFINITTEDYCISEETGTYKAAGANSISGVTPTASTAPSAGTWVGFVNITASSEDLSLIDFTNSEVNQAIGNGTPISGITTDWEGDTRDASTPDIGADEFVGAGVTTRRYSLSLTGVG